MGKPHAPSPLQVHTPLLNAAILAGHVYQDEISGDYISKTTDGTQVNIGGSANGAERYLAGAKTTLTFLIFNDNQLLREERLSLSVIKLGKGSSAHLKLDDEAVSRMHAVIEVNVRGDVSVIDLGSTNGTTVNGQRVIKAKLQSGDTIVVGRTQIKLVIGAGNKTANA